MSFYSTKGNNDLSAYKNYKGKILIKLKNGSECEVPENGIILVEKNNTDSIEAASYNSKPYEIYWLKNGRNLPFDMDESFNSSQDTINDFWAVMNGSTGKLRKVYDYDIDEIEIQEVNNLKTGLLISALATGLIVVLSSQKPKKTTIQIPEINWTSGWYY